MKSPRFSAEQIARSAMSSWVQALEESNKAKADKIPKGFKTVQEIAEEMGKSRRRASEVASQLAFMGTAEKRDFKILVGKTLRSVTHYRLR